MSQRWKLEQVSYYGTINERGYFRPDCQHMKALKEMMQKRECAQSASADEPEGV